MGTLQSTAELEHADRSRIAFVFHQGTACDALKDWAASHLDDHVAKIAETALPDLLQFIGAGPVYAVTYQQMMEAIDGWEAQQLDAFPARAELIGQVSSAFRELLISPEAIKHKMVTA